MVCIVELPPSPSIMCPNTAKYANHVPKYGQIRYLGRIFGRAEKGQVGIYLKRSCKMQFRRVDLVSIEPPSQKL